MNKQTIVLGIVAVIAMGVILTPQIAFAYKGNPAVKGPNYTDERHAAMEKAFETKNYTAWKELMAGRGRVLDVVNAQNFAQFAKAHELAEEGKITEANAIRTELGLGLHNGTGMGRGMGYNAKR